MQEVDRSCIQIEAIFQVNLFGVGVYDFVEFWFLIGRRGKFETRGQWVESLIVGSIIGLIPMSRWC